MAPWSLEIGYESDVPEPLEVGVDVAEMSLSTAEYFLLSRIDGLTSISQLFVMSGQSREDTVRMLQRLAQKRLIRLPNWTPPPEPEREEAGDATGLDDDEDVGFDITAPAWGPGLDGFDYPEDLLGCESDIPPALRRLVLYYHHYLREISYYELFQVDRSADRWAIRRAHLGLSKVFHPDRWFRRDLGPLDQPVDEVYRWVSKAYRTLSNPRRRAEYDRLIDAGQIGPWESSRVEEARRRRRARPPTAHVLGVNALVARAHQLRARRQYAAAADAFRRALSLNREDSLLMELAETLLEGQGDLDEALQAVREVNAEGSRNYAALLLEAKIQRARGDVSAARTICQRILAARPGYPGVREEFGSLLEE